MTIQELKELAKKATEAPWKVWDKEWNNEIYSWSGKVLETSDGFYPLNEADAQFISAARNHIEELIERYEQLAQALKHYATLEIDGDVWVNGKLDTDNVIPKKAYQALLEFGPHVPLGEKK